MEKFNALLLMLSLRLGLESMWDKETVTYDEHLMLDFLNTSPLLKLTKLSQAECLFRHLSSLSPNLYHVILPACDKPSFDRILAVK